MRGRSGPQGFAGWHAWCKWALVSAAKRRGLLAGRGGGVRVACFALRSRYGLGAFANCQGNGALRCAYAPYEASADWKPVLARRRGCLCRLYGRAKCGGPLGIGGGANLAKA